MAKSSISIIFVCLCLMFGIGVKSYAQTMISPEDLKKQMQEHIEKVKIKNPVKYKAMIERAGGNITNCCSCHKEVCEKNIFPAPQPQK